MDSEPVSDCDCRMLEDVVREAMARLGVPGVAIGIIHGDREILAGFGVNNVDHPLPVDADTIFQIGSISKTVAGTAAMRLVEQGKLDLDEPVRTYLPDFRLADPDVAARVTLRHLFTHTGGWVGDYFEHTGHGADALARMVGKLANLPQLTPLGEVFTYSNSGFYVAGRAIEVASGLPYERALRELVLWPLGMRMSFFRHFASEFITYRVAAGHEVRDGAPVVVRPWSRTRSAAPSGGVVSTARDILRYARFHLGDGLGPDGTRLLSPESMALMRTPLFPTDGMGGAVGITWMLSDVAGVPTVRHGGSTFGQRAVLVLVPSRSFALAVLTNAEQGEALHREVTRWALDRFLGVVEPTFVPLTKNDAELGEYVGRYVGALSDIEIAPRDGGLALRRIPRSGEGSVDPTIWSQLGFIGDDRAVVLDSALEGERGEFLRDSNGNIAWLRFTNRLHRRANPG